MVPPWVWALCAAVRGAFHSVEFELLRANHFITREQARRTVAAWIDEYNTVRRQLHGRNARSTTRGEHCSSGKRCNAVAASFGSSSRRRTGRAARPDSLDGSPVV
jgi:putative transposase